MNAEATLKRHGYYCRTRKGQSRPFRSRSCVACAKAKARCDNNLPSCLRCAAKNIQCRPQTGPVQRRRYLNNAGDERLTASFPACEEQVENTLPRTAQPPVTGSENDPLHLQSIHAVEEEFDWGALDVEIPGVQHLDVDANLIPPSQLDSTCQLLLNLPRPPSSTTAQAGQIMPAKSPSIPQMPSFSLRSFAQNPELQHGAQATALLLFRVLTSYPMMMRGEDSLPPFIHPYSLSHALATESKSMESLTTCVNLMQMVGTNMQGSRRLLWKNIRLECERLREEVRGSYIT